MANPRTDPPRPSVPPSGGAIPPAGPASDVAQSSTGDRDTGQLRASTDRGEMGDKVDYHDPATVPVQTDSEAGGNPYPTQKMEGVSRYGAANPAKTGTLDGQQAGYAPRHRATVSTIVVAAIVIGLVLLALMAFL